jgi:deazaflavin-dependent oxidoreductase (nitroreductase family)
MTTSKKPSRLLNSPIAAMIARTMGKAHTWIYRRTGGRVGGNLRLGAGLRKPAPTLLLEHRARKSGKTFVSPVIYIIDHSNVIIVASAGGRTENPQWYRNLLAHPDVHVQIGPDRRAVRAVVASGDERARLWPRLVDAYADFDSYQSSTERELPVIILQPLAKLHP